MGMTVIRMSDDKTKKQDSQLNEDTDQEKQETIVDHDSEEVLVHDETQALQEQIAQLTQELAEAKSREARAFADYQNLVRRSQQERMTLFKTAGKDFVEGILQPLEYLSVAAEQLNDKGLNMVLAQLWAALKQQGLEEIEVMGKPFDLTTMEAVETEAKGEKVTKIVRKGYTLNGEVIQFAKVVLG